MSTSHHDSLADGASPRPGEPALTGEKAGDRIGRYELLQEVGEGGFGVVWMAEQTEPVRRRVALKVIKLGMDTRQVVARFDAERQALALMDHPNIARVIDGGATEQGRPYFVMELVQGAPIVEFCDAQGLGVHQRLELMADVCRAVQHAHSKGIIHRDIKPSNVLVGHQDGRPQVKVIDFGIAKATGQQLTEKTLFTEHRQVIGTLQYMSPEQAQGSLDIDTRTDVYSLGVLLYELLAGSPPFDIKTFKGMMLHELQRIIREVDPPKPSTRLSESEEVLVHVAARRRVEPRRLRTLLRGELDWIVMKALEKDRSRRYGTASALAEDLGRFLGGEAVAAAPPSAAYRLRKALRRHRGPVTAAALVVAALAAGLAAFAWQADVARDQRDRAVAAEEEALERANELEVVAEFQSDMLEQVDPSAAGRALTEDVTRRLAEALAAADLSDAERTARATDFERLWGRVNATDAARELIDATILRPAARAVAERFPDQPAVRARLQQTLADRYRDLGLLDAARPLQEAALATRREIFGPNHVDTLVSQDSLGLLHRARGDYAAAEVVLRGALEASLAVLGKEHPATLDRLNNVGHVLAYQGRFDEAEGIHVEVLELQRRVNGRESPEALTALNNLAYLLDVSGRSDEAEALYSEAVAGLRRVQGDEHTDTLSALCNLGVLLHFAGRLDEAEPLYREALAGRRRVRGEDHPDTLQSLSNLGALLKTSGKLEEAEPLYVEALEKKRRVLGPDHPETLISINNLAGLLWAKGDLEGAERCYEDALERKVRTLGMRSESSINTVLSLGDLRLERGRDTEALQLLIGAEDDVRALYGERRPEQVARLLSTRGRARTRLGELDAAEVDLRAAVALLGDAGEPPDSKARVRCDEALAELGAVRSRTTAKDDE